MPSGTSHVLCLGFGGGLHLRFNICEHIRADFFFFFKEKWIKHPPTAFFQEMFLIIKTSIVLNVGHTWAFPFLGGFNASQTATFKQRSARLPTGQLVVSAATWARSKDPRSISVWECIIMWPGLYLNHLFLPLRHWEKGFQSLEGRLVVLHPIHHECSLQWMDGFHVHSPTRSPAPSSAAPNVWMLMHCSRLQPPRAITLCTHTSPGSWVDHLYPFFSSSGTSGSGCNC